MNTYRYRRRDRLGCAGIVAALLAAGLLLPQWAMGTTLWAEGEKQETRVVRLPAAGQAVRRQGWAGSRWLNQRQAGEDGFITVQGEHFAYGKTGRAVRFWAVNGPPQELKDSAALGKPAQNFGPLRREPRPHPSRLFR